MLCVLSCVFFFFSLIFTQNDYSAFVLYQYLVRLQPRKAKQKSQAKNKQNVKGFVLGCLKLIDEQERMRWRRKRDTQRWSQNQRVKNALGAIIHGSMESTDYNTHANLKWKQKQFPWIGFRIYTAALSCSFTCFCVFFRFSNVKHSVCFLALPLCTRTLHLIQFIFACVYSLSSESQEQIGRFFLLARLSTPCICNAYMHIV